MRRQTFDEGANAESKSSAGRCKSSKGVCVEATVLYGSLRLGVTCLTYTLRKSVLERSFDAPRTFSALQTRFRLKHYRPLHSKGGDEKLCRITIELKRTPNRFVKKNPFRGRLK